MLEDVEMSDSSNGNLTFSYDALKSLSGFCLSINNELAIIWCDLDLTLP